MGKRKRRMFPKRKRSVFSRPHPIKRKMMIRQRRLKAFFHRHNPRVSIERGMRKMVGGFYTVSDKVRDKIAESTLALDNPFSAQFYEDRKGQKKQRKLSVFSHPYPIKRKMQRRLKAFFHRHNPRVSIERGMRKMVGGFYTVSDKVRDKIAESTLALDNPFSAQFYEDRCSIQ